MRKLVSFTQVTLDGYFAGADGDIAWTHKNVGPCADHTVFVARSPEVALQHRR